jgi:hypothetical protein
MKITGAIWIDFPPSKIRSNPVVRKSSASVTF